MLDAEDSEILVASLSLTELARRLRELGANEAEARRTLDDYREVLDDVVPVDERIALTAFDIGCKSAKRLPLVDALIAATALENGACLVHRDQHMREIPAGLVEQLDLAPDLIGA